MRFTETDERMMRLALDEARRALAEGEVPVGAVVARGAQVLSTGHNSRETAHDPCGHAEINALRAAAKALGGWRLTGCTLYVTLEPCCMCAGAAAQARLARIVYGASDPGAGCCGSVYRLSEDPALPWYTPADGGLLAEECRQALLAFKAD